MPPKLLLSEVSPLNFEEAMQQAIEIEIATIPVYLYTYYSVNREPDQDKIQADVTAAMVKRGISKADAEAKALDLSAKMMVYANKTGALIMSVVIEEMLHMALSSNVKQSLSTLPMLVYKTPTEWPAQLPGHEPPFDINRAKLSKEQLYTFMQIENPGPLPTGKDDKPTAIPYTSIGEFYDLIIACIKKNYSKDSDYDTTKPQLVPGKGYYYQNTIDTVYYDKKHKPRFTNAEDSGDLIHSVNAASAIAALEEIKHQGEGNTAQGLNPDGSVPCDGVKPGDYDDPNFKELSHFSKFNRIYCQYDHLTAEFREAMGDKDFDIRQYYVLNYETNPSQANYPPTVQKVSLLLNAVYTYIFVMTENCYRKDGDTQYEIFMFGIHKSMIFILNSLCGDISTMQYTGQDGLQYVAAPTFEDYWFSDAKPPKEQLIELFNDAVAVFPGISYLADRIHDLPNVPVEPYMEPTSATLFS